ncbi:MAG: hypothetical protein Q9217_004262 [Psora testacea]
MKASTSTLLLLRPTSSTLQTCKTTSRPLPRLSNGPRPVSHQIRAFSNTLTPLQTLTASRILPYHAHEIYKIIADIPSYPSFIPYCTSSTITSTSAPDPTYNIQWPRTADLRIGYGPYDEVFNSAVYCLPYTALEAVSGDAEPTIMREKLPHYYEHAQQPRHSAGHGSIFSSLLTRWKFKEFPFKPAPPDGSPPQEGDANQLPSSPRTEVNLFIEVRFASAVYSALSQVAAPKVAGMMIEAFEKRAKEVLGEGKGPISRAEKDGDRSALQGVVGGSMKM